MSRIVQVTKVQDTCLWKILSKHEDQDAHTLSTNIVNLCDEAIERMKAMYAYAPQYTLHDDRHLLRVTVLMGLILDSEAENLNVIELTLLILSAFFHDQGMVLTKNEYLSLKTNGNFQFFQDNWLIEHPNYRETEAQITASHCSEMSKLKFAEQIAELNGALLTDFIRETHGSRSADFIKSTYGSDKRIEICNVNLAPFLAALCESHTLSCEELNSIKGFRYDEQIGIYTVNLPFLAVVLRIADILDFDRDRTPETLLKNIHFTSPISLLEWEKHRSVEGWQISKDLIRFSIKCEHPAYEVAARKYMDWIDRELTACQNICRIQPRKIKGYQLNLPTNVDRSRIEPLDNAYRFHDLEFNLSRDEIVHLLMTDKLYGKEHLCIRELLQNSLDALRYRKALFSDKNEKWDEGKVKLRHYINEDGYEVLECTDNGSGMDEEIIKNHFVKVGRSFYRSPNFERERNRLKASGNDFDPCSRFGIGFMSCFMLGDRITITTRRDYGPGREYGTPLNIEIHGLSGLLVIREGCSNQRIGTTVSIVSRQRPSFIDSWTDKVQLCRVLKGYALATEFPIVGHCAVPEVQETVIITNSPEITPTLLECAQVKNYISFSQDLSQVSPCLGGFARDSFLTDDDGLPCIANTEAQWRGKREGVRNKWYIELLQTNRKHDYDDTMEWSVPVCIDGILIAGIPGRSSFRKDVFMRLGCRNSNIYSSSPALIDARGHLKPEITPGRVPPDHIGSNLPPGWKRLRDSFNQGQGLLWEKLSDYLGRGLIPETFWKLVVVHGISVGWIPCNTLWETLSVSLIENEHIGSWRLVRDLGEMSMFHGNNVAFVLQDNQGLTIRPDSELEAWEKQGEEHPHLGWSMNSIVLLMSCLDVRDGKVTLFPSPPSNPRTHLAQYSVSSGLGVSMFLLNYVGNASDFLAVQTPFPTANRNHVLVKLYHQSRYANEPNDLQTFVRSFILCISESLSTRDQTLSLDKPGYWQKRVGHLYFSVRWDHYDKSFHPPYKLWTEDKGEFYFREENFAKWRDAPASFE